MTVPRKLKIGASYWDVVINSREESGLCDAQGHIISLNKNLQSDEMEETLLHEIIHTACTFAGMMEEKEKYTQEEFTRRISPTLHMILKENGAWFPPDEPDIHQCYSET